MSEQAIDHGQTNSPKDERIDQLSNAPLTHSIEQPVFDYKDTDGTPITLEEALSTGKIHNVRFVDGKIVYDINTINDHDDPRSLTPLIDAPLTPTPHTINVIPPIPTPETTTEPKLPLVLPTTKPRRLHQNQLLHQQAQHRALQKLFN